MGTRDRSCSHFISVSATLSFSGDGPLMLFLFFSLGSLPWKRIFYYVLQCESFPWDVVLHELPQCGSPTGPQVLPANLLQHALLSPQVFAPVWASHVVTASFRHPLASVWGPPRAAEGQSVSPWSSPWPARVISARFFTLWFACGNYTINRNRYELDS